LIKALKTKGDGNNELARNSVKALLNSIEPNSDGPVCDELLTLKLPFASIISADMVPEDNTTGLP